MKLGVLPNTAKEICKVFLKRNQSFLLKKDIAFGRKKLLNDNIILDIMSPQCLSAWVTYTLAYRTGLIRDKYNISMTP